MIILPLLDNRDSKSTFSSKSMFFHEFINIVLILEDMLIEITADGVVVCHNIVLFVIFF